MKHYLIIGGTTGIGNEIVKLLIKNEQNVTVIARKATNLNSNVRFHAMDITKENKQWPSIDQLDGLVYCPGTINLKPFQSLNTDDFLNDFSLNFLGAANAIKHYLPLLKKSKGSIVLFSTVAVQTGMPFHCSVSASKGAIEGFTRSLAAELTPTIRVNAIAPSLSDTPLAEPFLSSDEKRASAQKRNPMGKIGNPAEIAKTALFLLSEDSSWVTGQIIHVDGGMGSLKLL